jgi:hypothetical protein
VDAAKQVVVADNVCSLSQVQACIGMMTALQGPSPSIQVYATDSLQLLATINLGFGLGYTALAFSANGDRLAICGEEPDNQIVIYRWREVCAPIRVCKRQGPGYAVLATCMEVTATWPQIILHRARSLPKASHLQALE